jgi:hypothetical protein
VQEQSSHSISIKKKWQKLCTLISQRTVLYHGYPMDTSMSTTTFLDGCHWIPQWEVHMNVVVRMAPLHSPFYCPILPFLLIKQSNSVAWVHERTIPTQRPSLVDKVSANVLRTEVPRGQRDRSLRSYYRISRPESLLFLPNSSSIVLTRLSEPHYRPTTFQKIW